MKSLLLPLLAAIALPSAAQAEIRDEIHKRNAVSMLEIIQAA